MYLYKGLSRAREEGFFLLSGTSAARGARNLESNDEKE